VPSATVNEASKSLSDFRTELYERYVSTFKGDAQDAEASSGTAISAPDLGDYLGWFQYKYLPLFEGLPADSRILELGCGPGDMIDFLGQSGFSAVEGIDLSPEQIRIATNRGLTARVADVFEFLASSQQKYRVILAFDFVEHFSKDELVRLVPAMHAALEPGGHLLLQTANGQGLFPGQVAYGDLTHLTIFTPESLMQILRLWNFEDFRFVETGPVPVTVNGKIRLLAWKLITWCANQIRKIESGKTQEIWTENMICRCTKARD
jgi:2-polyprenyl-3-methyl-5-hydroxy-6-metoxy-1,4-benzoquinol methylase